jgi:hypothetical protein
VVARAIAMVFRRGMPDSLHRGDRWLQAGVGPLSELVLRPPS